MLIDWTLCKYPFLGQYIGHCARTLFYANQYIGHCTWTHFYANRLDVVSGLSSMLIYWILCKDPFLCRWIGPYKNHFYVNILENVGLHLLPGDNRWWKCHQLVNKYLNNSYLWNTTSSQFFSAPVINFEPYFF